MVSFSQIFRESLDPRNKSEDDSVMPKDDRVTSEGGFEKVHCFIEEKNLCLLFHMMILKKLNYVQEQL